MHRTRKARIVCSNQFLNLKTQSSLVRPLLGQKLSHLPNSAFRIAQIVHRRRDDVRMHNLAIIIEFDIVDKRPARSFSDSHATTGMDLVRNRLARSKAFRELA